MKTAIVTDSNSDITQEEAKQLGIRVVPMPFLIDGEQYYEDITLTQDEFYKKLLAGDAQISTSQPSTYDVGEIWTELLKDYDKIIYIPMSSGLSETCHTLTRYAETEFPGKVYVIDNQRISITLRQSVLDAIKLANEGKTAEEIRDYLLATKMQSSIYIMVDTLKYLKKGGRITPAVAMTLPEAKLSGTSSAHTTATIAPAEKASAKGRMPLITVTANAPSTPAAISTAPES